MRALLLLLVIPGAMAWSLGDAPSGSLEGAYAPGEAAAIPVDGTALWVAAPETERQQFMSDVWLEVTYTGTASGTRVATLMRLAPDGSMTALGAAPATGPAGQDTFILPVEGQILEPGDALVLGLRYPVPVVIDGAASGFELPLITVPAPPPPQPEAEPAPEPETIVQEPSDDRPWILPVAGLALVGVAAASRYWYRLPERAPPVEPPHGPRRHGPVGSTADQVAGPLLPEVVRPRQDAILEEVQAQLVAVGVVQATKRPKETRCTAITASGARCQQAVAAGTDRCAEHQEPARRAAGPWA